ncbi:MAG: helix-turn-helix domain-containing protein [Opitutaceae bacterium]|jgi:putative transcriptional regulator|nr:helix-turn-helix domain-containing protein [Opitutaceae bacterium]
MKDILELGTRVRHHRIAMGLKQAELAEKAAVSVDVLSALENGRSVTSESLARVLAGLGHSDALVDLLPAPVVSPIDLQKLAGKQRKRVRL